VHFAHIYENDESASILVAALSNDCFAVSFGSNVQIWVCSQNQWHIKEVLSYRNNLDVIQIIPNQRIKIAEISKAPHLVILYKDGNICFWHQTDYTLTY